MATPRLGFFALDFEPGRRRYRSGRPNETGEIFGAEGPAQMMRWPSRQPRRRLSRRSMMQGSYSQHRRRVAISTTAEGLIHISDRIKEMIRG